LGVFELLTARFWPHDINLRELWDRARAEHPIIADFDVDPYYVLQAIALASRRVPSCKRSDVLNLANTDIDQWWPKVIAGMAIGLEILRDDCKVVLPKWLPYQTMLAPIAAVLAKAGFPKTAEAGVHRDKLKRWFWCAVFGQAYESAPNSQSVRDVTALTEWLAGGSLPETIAAFRFDPKTPLTRRCSPRRATKSGNLGAPPVPTTSITRVRPSFSIPKGFPPSTTPSPVVERYHWKRGGWGWRATRAT
jgi:hypothetical protein